jgi:hypothetical protein
MYQLKIISKGENCMTSKTRTITRKIVIRKTITSDEEPRSRGDNRDVRKEPHSPGSNGAVRKQPEMRNDMPYFGMVNLRIHEIECIKSTKEIDLDEIILAAIKVEGKLEKSAGKEKLAARAEKGEVLNAGKFKNGENRRYSPPRTVATIPSGGKDMGWPRYYYATLVMIEQDEGAVGKVVNEVVKSVEKEVAEVVSKAVSTAAVAALSGLAAGAAAGSTIPFIGTAVGAAVGTSIGLVASEIKKARKDDVFQPENVHLRLERFSEDGGQVEEPKRAVFQGFRGHYVVTYSWALS